ncbi:hypothetical protein ACFY1U_14345 [Streptomyces sp. NPDC001351]|uniref:hypothetical protein n=1 Tax=Streptomyces sp. NPDC001351 TaxID=3364564 RepID=UPI0036A6689E
MAGLVDQPRVRNLGAGPGRRLQVQDGVALPDLLACLGVGDDGAGVVALVEFDALGVELGVLQFDSGDEGFAGLDTGGADITDLRQAGGDRIGLAFGAERRVERAVVRNPSESRPAPAW